MKERQERLQATIPKSNYWHLSDVEEKAKSYGMDKSEFILKGVGMLQNLEPFVFEEIKKKCAALHIPEWLFIQNILIKYLAEYEAYKEVYGDKIFIRVEFLNCEIGEDSGKLLTGGRLFKAIKELAIENYNEEKKSKGDDNQVEDQVKPIMRALSKSTDDSTK